MTAARPGSAPTLDLDAVVAPFRAADGLDIAIEDAAGTPIASTSAGAPPETAAARDIEGGVLAGGRVLAWGDGPAAGLAPAVAGSLVAALAGIHLHDDAAAERQAATARLLEHELALSRQVQRSFVSLVPPAVPGWEIAAHYEAAREVGGDFFEFFRLRRRGRPLGIVIADVTGKGIAAALLMAFSRPLLHAAIDHTTSPSDALVRVNRILVEERRSSLFITALVARLDVRTGHLQVANAGHEPPLVVRGDGSPVGCLTDSGPLLGAFDRLELPETGTDLGAGDLVVMYTDGVTDARSATGERFDEWRLLEAVERARAGSAGDVVREIADSVGAFQGPADVADDITIVAVRRLRDRT